MKSLLASILTLFAFSAQADPYFMDGNALNQKLTRQDPSAIAYIFGVYDGIQVIQYHAPAAERLICTPAAVTDTELVDAVRGYLDAEPAILNFPAAIVVLRAWVWAFPCGNT
jgi:Ssp1 endopeptidase immunity protein Rap1a